MPDRPPKPEGVAPKPRFKKRGASTKLAGILGKVRALSDTKDLDDAAVALRTSQVYARLNDRGAAILLASEVEHALDCALISRLTIHDGQKADLFRSNGPLGSLSAKITLAYALDVFGSEMKANLDIIRAVRNAFAHISSPLTFGEEAIKEACAYLIIPRVRMKADSKMRKTRKDIKGGRNRYTIVCNIIICNLTMYSFQRDFHADDGTVVTSLVDIIGPQEPLP